ncbi:MAG: chromate efflux transporter [Methanoregula sp.]|jgi:chromate transporter|uniref:chromate efflux transporter n=1 Tax=Methanoregula sp. TaxID=2052170 RepID=UPI003C28E058
MVDQPIPSELQQPSLASIFFAFFRIGITAFGGPAMVSYIRKMVVGQKGWLDSVVFDDGVALCQAIPGATAMQVTAYAGLRIRGTAGAFAAFVGFGLPAFILMMILSALYVSTSALPPVMALFLALQAIVVALVAYATVSFGRTSLKHWIHVLIAGIAAVLFIAGVSPVVVIVLAALLGITLLPVSDKKQEMPVTTFPRPEKSFLILLAIAAAFFILLYLLQSDLYTLAATMARIDLFAFGGGFAALPLMFHEVVVVHSWLDSATFINGLALGQVTPGPIVVTATFVGFLAYGFWGGIVATIGIFTPSFLFAVGTVPYYDRLRSSQLYQKMFQGILFSFVGLLLSVTIKLALAVPWSWFPGLLATGAFLSLLLGAEILWVVIAGIGIAVVMFVFVH